jgi:hypothetical protein
VPFSPDVVAAVLRHMNDDHLGDSLLIAQAFGSPDAESALMTDLDENGGTFVYSLAGEDHAVVVPWSVPISRAHA